MTKQVPSHEVNDDDNEEAVNSCHSNTTIFGASGKLTMMTNDHEMNNDNDQKNKEVCPTSSSSTTTPPPPQSQPTTNSYHTYDQIIILSLFAILGIIGRLFTASNLDPSSVLLKKDSPLFTNLPLNCWSCFIMGLLCTRGVDGIWVLYGGRIFRGLLLRKRSRSNRKREEEEKEKRKDDDDDEEDCEEEEEDDDALPVFKGVGDLSMEEDTHNNHRFRRRQRQRRRRHRFQKNRYFVPTLTSDPYLAAPSSSPAKTTEEEEEEEEDDDDARKEEVGEKEDEDDEEAEYLEMLRLLERCMRQSPSLVLFPSFVLQEDDDDDEKGKGVSEEDSKKEPEESCCQCQQQQQQQEDVIIDHNQQTVGETPTERRDIHNHRIKEEENDDDRTIYKQECQSRCRHCQTLRNERYTDKRDDDSEDTMMTTASSTTLFTIDDEDDEELGVEQQHQQQQRGLQHGYNEDETQVATIPEEEEEYEEEEEEEEDDDISQYILLGLRVGFCGALSTFSSWNSDMVYLLRNGYWYQALLGYGLGLLLPIMSYLLGIYMAVFLFVWRLKDFKERTENGEEVDLEGSDWDLGLLDDGFCDEEEEEVLCVEAVAVDTKIILKKDADHNQHENDTKTTPKPPQQQQQQDEYIPPSNNKKTKIRILSTLLLTLITTSLIFTLLLETLTNDSTNNNQKSYEETQLFVISMLFSPLGVLTRWKLSNQLNPLLPHFPLGTFVCNVMGCALSGCVNSILATSSSGDGIWNIVLWRGMINGFVGSLSSLSTFVVEIVDGMDVVALRLDGLEYGLVTVFWGLVVGFVTRQAKDWADEV